MWLVQILLHRAHQVITSDLFALAQLSERLPNVKLGVPHQLSFKLVLPLIRQQNVLPRRRVQLSRQVIEALIIRKLSLQILWLLCGQLCSHLLGLWHENLAELTVFDASINDSVQCSHIALLLVYLYLIQEYLGQFLLADLTLGPPVQQSESVDSIEIIAVSHESLPQ